LREGGREGRGESEWLGGGGAVFISLMEQKLRPCLHHHGHDMYKKQNKKTS